MTAPASVRWLAGLPAPQARYWFAEQMSPGSPDAMDSFVFRLSGPVDPTALRRSLRNVVCRHNALRSLIRREKSRGLQVTVIEPGDTGEVLEVRHTDPGAHEPVLREFIARPFRLDRDIPVRALLVVPGDVPGQGHFVVSAHHTAFDGWSATVFFSELSDAYRELVHGNPPPPCRTSDYRQVWRDQSEAETETDQQALMEWARELVGVPDLPLPRVSPPAASGALREKSVALGTRHIGLIAGAARLKATTPNAILLTAWVRALRSLTGGTDFAVALPVSGRTSLASTTIIGCFVSVAPLRFRGSDADVDSDLDQTIAGLARALRFQFMPLEQVVSESGPRDPHRTPLCQAAFVSQEQTDLTLRLADVECVHIPRLKTESAFELTLEVWFGGEITARIRHRVDVLDDQRATLLADLWRSEVETVARSVMEDPSR
ncbi:condensation domain-containing protein [Kitasatospora sp. NPDC001175]|uniref:condensation domain-containing protein n=1 Tax=Kitasatospora sp. NPDC001175 TaxID=3157103 RepID=UPI003D015299